MKRFLIVALLVLIPPSAWADDAKQFFDSLFGNRLKQVKATIDRADDIALAREMLAAAQTLERADVLAILCDNVVDLTQRHADGLPTAIEALALLAERVEPRRAETRKKQAELLTRLAASTDAKVKQKAADDLIALLVLQGDEAVKAQKIDDAVAAYRQALSAAQRFKSPTLELIKSKMEAVAHRDRALKQIARLQEKVLANANDAASAEEIIKLYVVDLDNPAEAVKFLDRTKDAKLTKLVPLAAKPLHSSEAADSAALGEWYLELATSAAGPSKEPMWRRVSSHLTRYLESGPTETLAKTKAELQLKTVSASIASIETARVEKELARSEPESWISADATYKVNTSDGHHPSLPGLLTGGQKLNGGHFAFTTPENKGGQYITIDLGTPKIISRIWIENRRDQGKERAKGITLWLSDESNEKSEKVWTAEKVADEYPIKLPKKALVRYITIKQAEKSTEPLHLAQVKVFGWEK